MAIRKIITDKSILTQRSTHAAECESEPVITDLYQTLLAQADPPAVGLAAPQIGYPVRIIAVLDGSEVIILCNPTIDRIWGREYYGNEGCLSFPRYFSCKVKRRSKVRVTYRDKYGKMVTRTFRMFMARVIQHELDHLNGILMDSYGKGRY